MMREMVLTAASLALTGTVVANAYYQKHQFYPSVVYLTKSSPSMAVLYLQAFVFVILLGKLIRKVFFGQLRAAEMEHLIERSWYAVTETCLAFTVFRDDFSPRFVAQFTMLLFVKCFHWLAEDRIDYMERSPVLTWLFHARAVALLTFLGLIDSFLIHVAYNTTIQSGASVQLVFGFEYAILLTIVATIIMKYTLHVIDLQSENPWDNKAVYLLYTELIMGFIKAVLYICFVGIMVKVHTFPLFAIRPMYLTLRSFKKSLSDVIMSRRAIANMNTLYPDATPEELSQGDNVCIICREEMTTGCKKIPCNHIFHASCLRSWFQRQQTCPTCRMDVLRPMPRPSPPPQPAQHQQPNGPQAMPQFGMFPGWPPAPPQQFQQQPGQQPSTPQTDGASSTPATGMETSQQQMAGFINQVPPFSMPPPFMMPPPPFMMPPSMFGMPFGPPSSPTTVDLSSSSVEELKNIEEQERQNLENRIAMLRSIHTLLDNALSQMNNYTAMYAQSNSPVNQGVSGSSAPKKTTTNLPTSDWPSLSNISSPSSTKTTPTTTSENTTSSKKPNQTTTITTSITTSPTTSSSNITPNPSTTTTLDENNKTFTETPPLVAEGTVAHDNAKLEATPEPETIGNAEDENESSELRRRRLERFTKEETT